MIEQFHFCTSLPIKPVYRTEEKKQKARAVYCKDYRAKLKVRKESAHAKEETVSIYAKRRGRPTNHLPKKDRVAARGYQHNTIFKKKIQERKESIYCYIL